MNNNQLQNQNGRQQLQTQNQNADAEKFTICVENPSEFPSLVEGIIITSNDLMEKVSELFSVAYKDYVGCFIAPRINGLGFDVKLYFSTPAVDNGGATYAFETNQFQQKSKSGGLLSTLNYIERRSSQRAYSITKHGRDGLSDFFSLPRGKGIDQYIGEEQQNSNINAGVFATVTGLDIYKIVSTIYGVKNENNEYLQYSIMPLKQIGPMTGTGTAMNWILKIDRLSMKELDKLARKVGIVQTGGIPMVGRINVR